MRTPLVVLAAAALAVLLVVGLLQAGGSEGDATPSAEPPAFDLGAARERLAGAPAPLAGLHAQSAELVPGDPDAFAARLRDLRGHPVVVNKWASWCGPCRSEFPIFQRQATALGTRVAFLGLNSRDGSGPASEFLGRFPVPYPSYEDPEEDIARDIGAPANYPVTVFYDARGRRTHIKQGGYRTEADLVADIRRYATQ